MDNRKSKKGQIRYWGGGAASWGKRSHVSSFNIKRHLTYIPSTTIVKIEIIPIPVIASAKMEPLVCRLYAAIPNITNIFQT